MNNRLEIMIKMVFLFIILIAFIIMSVNATDESTTKKSIAIDDDSLPNMSVLLYSTKEVQIFRSRGYISLCLYKD